MVYPSSIGNHPRLATGLEYHRSITHGKFGGWHDRPGLLLQVKALKRIHRAHNDACLVGVGTDQVIRQGIDREQFLPSIVLNRSIRTQAGLRLREPIRVLIPISLSTVRSAVHNDIARHAHTPTAGHTYEGICQAIPQFPPASTP